MDMILESAIELGQIGFCSFPVNSVENQKCQCGNNNCRSKGKHPRISSWKHRATKNSLKLKSLFNPDDNLGIVTGSKSNLIVIDVDPKNGGLDSYDNMTKTHGPIDEHTLVANTGGGGFHIFYDCEDDQIGNSAGSVFGPGIDIKCNGGFVVGAPSRHVSGNNYYWRDGLYRPAALPTDLELEITKDKQLTEHDHLNNKYTTKDIQKGTRNTTLTSMAGRYRSKGYEQEKLTKHLLQDNLDRCKPSLSEKEVKSIANSVCKYEAGNSSFDFVSFWLRCIFNDNSNDLDHGTKGILTALSYLMDGDGKGCTAPQALIAKKAGCTSVTVSLKIKKAVQLGWIQQYHLPKTNGDKGIFCKYIPNIPKPNTSK